MISVFTPTNNSSFLPMIYESLKAQTYTDWEWIIVFNNGAVPLSFEGDKRVRTITLSIAPEWVGPLKAFACEQAKGSILLELDHDDLLLPEALEEAVKAFEDPEIGFVYSNTVHVTGDLKKTKRYDERYGWKFREMLLNDEKVDECVSFDPTPHSISRIWYAPNHFRAFRKSVYDSIGGYNKKMRVLDDLDIMCRMYLATKFKMIDKPLYVYRIHGENSWLKHNQEIQDNVYRIYNQYIIDMAIKWADLNGLRKLDLGGRINAKEGLEKVDLQDADIIADLEQDWPIESGSVGVVRAWDVFEHLKDPIHTMKELYRVLAPGGFAFIRVPSTDGRGAFQDPLHKSFWNANSFMYYTDRNRAYYIGTPVRFQAMHIFTTELNKDKVCWVNAHLVKLDGNMRLPGLIDI